MPQQLVIQVCLYFHVGFGNILLFEFLQASPARFEVWIFCRPVRVFWIQAKVKQAKGDLWLLCPGKEKQEIEATRFFAAVNFGLLLTPLYLYWNSYDYCNIVCEDWWTGLDHGRHRRQSFWQALSWKFFRWFFDLFTSIIVVHYFWVLPPKSHWPLLEPCLRKLAKRGWLCWLQWLKWQLQTLLNAFLFLCSGDF